MSFFWLEWFCNLRVYCKLESGASYPVSWCHNIPRVWTDHRVRGLWGKHQVLAFLEMQEQFTKRDKFVAIAIWHTSICLGLSLFITWIRQDTQRKFTVLAKKSEALQETKDSQMLSVSLSMRGFLPVPQWWRLSELWAKTRSLFKILCSFLIQLSDPVDLCVTLSCVCQH